MNSSEFTQSLGQSDPSADLTPRLRALWLERRGDWDGAHRIVQKLDDRLSCNVHVYLHRKEPDEANARYWYGRVGIPFPAGKAFDAEWEELLAAALGGR